MNKVPERHIGVRMKAHVHMVLDGPDRAMAERVRGLAAAELDIGQEHAEPENEIGPLDALTDRGRAYRADVDPHVKWMIHRKSALGEHRSAAGSADLLDELDDVL